MKRVPPGDKRGCSFFVQLILKSLETDLRKVMQPNTAEHLKVRLCFRICSTFEPRLHKTRYPLYVTLLTLVRQLVFGVSV